MPPDVTTMSSASPPGLCGRLLQPGDLVLLCIPPRADRPRYVCLPCASDDRHILACGIGVGIVVPLETDSILGRDPGNDVDGHVVLPKSQLPRRKRHTRDARLQVHGEGRGAADRELDPGAPDTASGPSDTRSRGVEPTAAGPHEAAPFREGGVGTGLGEDGSEVDPALVVLGSGVEDLEAHEARAPAEVEHFGRPHLAVGPSTRSVRGRRRVPSPGEPSSPSFWALPRENDPGRGAREEQVR